MRHQQVICGLTEKSFQITAAVWAPISLTKYKPTTKWICHLKGSKTRCNVHGLVIFEGNDDHEPPFSIPTVITTTLTPMNFYSKTNQLHSISKFILFCNNTLHVSDSLSFHHQESKTIHIASGIRHTFPLASSQKTCVTYTLCCMYSLRPLMMDGKTVRNM
jgi:hypothetical protein